MHLKHDLPKLSVHQHLIWFNLKVRAMSVRKPPSLFRCGISARYDHEKIKSVYWYYVLYICLHFSIHDRSWIFMIWKWAKIVINRFSVTITIVLRPVHLNQMLSPLSRCVIIDLDDHLYSTNVYSLQKPVKNRTQISNRIIIRTFKTFNRPDWGSKAIQLMIRFIQTESAIREDPDLYGI